MRNFPIILFLLVTLTIFGLLPRPLIKPDWRTSYNAAIVSDDCKAIERTVELLFIVGLGVEGHTETYNNHKAGRCKYANLSEQEVKIAQALGHFDGKRYGQNFVRRSFHTSPFGKFYQVYKRKKHPPNKIVIEHERQMIRTGLSCSDKVRPVANGFPNYSLFKYALNNPTVSNETIAAIASKQRAACAKKIVADIEIITSAATTPGEYVSIIRYLWTAYVIAEESPEIGPVIDLIAESIPDEAYTLAGFTKQDSVPTSICPTWYADRVLEAAINCALRASTSAGADAAINAIYYSRRAKRLGWHDISQIEGNAANQISAECRDAIIQIEEKEAAGNVDPSAFRKLDWPINSGEVCGPVDDKSSEISAQ